MPRDRDHRHREHLHRRSVQQNHALYRAVNQHSRIFLNQVRLPTMARNKIKVPFPQQVIFDATHD